MRIGLLRLRAWYKFIPTALTLGNTLCGFTAILCTLQVYAPEQGTEIRQLLAFLHLHEPQPGDEIRQLLGVSAWLIVGALVFDMLDGWSARLLNAASPYGVQMDSLADMVTFGVAPAVMVVVMAQTQQLVAMPYFWVWLLCAIYLACAALRLALYNVKVESGEPTDMFQGLPSPGGAAAVASLVLLYSDPKSDTMFQYILVAQYLPFYAAILGFLMVTKTPYMHVGKWLGSKRNNKLKIMVLITFFLLFNWHSRLVAAVTINVYVLSGPLRDIILWLYRVSGAGRRAERRAEADG
jgi:CDP-diacylglycerol--serine O-phosphatidyltransferase